VDVDEAAKAGVDVVRRISGGGAVLHDRDREITYSVVVSESDFSALFGNLPNLEVFHKITEGITRALYKLAVRPDQGVIHCPAIFIDGKKISGNAQARRKGVILQHGTILLDVDAEFMYSILKVPQGVSKTHMVRSVYAKVAGIREYIHNVEVSVLEQCLQEGFAESLGVAFELGTLTPEEEADAKQLIEERYANPAWNTRLA
jgi:lipoate-protein ligase A